MIRYMADRIDIDQKRRGPPVPPNWANRICSACDQISDVLAFRPASPKEAKRKRLNNSKDAETDVTLNLATNKSYVVSDVEGLKETIDALETNLKAAGAENTKLHEVIKVNKVTSAKEIEKLEIQVETFKKLAIESIVDQVIKSKNIVPSKNPEVKPKKKGKQVHLQPETHDDLSTNEAFMSIESIRPEGHPGSNINNYAMAARKPPKLPKSRQQLMSTPKPPGNNKPKKKEVKKDFIVVASRANTGNEANTDSIYSLVRKELRQNIKIREAKITIFNVKEIASGKVLIFVSSEEEVETLTNILSEVQGRGFDVRKSQRRKPLIKINGIFTDASPEEVVREIFQLNPIGKEIPINRVEDYGQLMKLAYMKKTKRGRNKEEVRDMVFECTPQIHKQLMKQRHIKIHCQVVQAYNKSRFVQCYRCCGYNHTSEKCPLIKENKFICSKCCGNHKASECQVTPDQETCYNCAEHNKKQRPGSKNKHDIRHPAVSRKCPVRIAAVERITKSTDTA